MSTVQLMREGLDALRGAGCEIREEWLDGSGGGCCQLRGKSIYFVDLAIAPEDQLAVLLRTLRDEPLVEIETLSPELREAIERNP